MKLLCIIAIVSIITVLPAFAQTCPPTHYLCGDGTCCSK